MHNIQQTDAHIVVTTQSMKWKKNIQGCGFLFGADIVAAVGMSWYDVGADHSPVLAADMWIFGWYVVDAEHPPDLAADLHAPPSQHVFSHCCRYRQIHPPILACKFLVLQMYLLSIVHVEHCWTHLSVGMMLRLMINTPFVHLSFRSLSLDKILKREFLDSYSEAFTTVDS